MWARKKVLLIIRRSEAVWRFGDAAGDVGPLARGIGSPLKLSDMALATLSTSWRRKLWYSS